MKCVIVNSKDLFGPMNPLGKISASIGFLTVLLNKDTPLTISEKLEVLYQIVNQSDNNSSKSKKSVLKLLAKNLPLPLNTINYLREVGKLGPFDTTQRKNMQDVAKLLEEHKARTLERRSLKYTKMIRQLRNT